jgi:predicted DNA-binding protein YlxM (UPF0122 family)
MAVLRMLEENDMNLSETAYEAGISRQALHGWKNDLWEEYEATKEQITDRMLTVQAKKLVMYEGTSKTVDDTKKLFDRGIEHFNDPVNFESLENKEKIELLKTIAPYVLEKRVQSGAKEPTRQTNFYTNILNQLKQSNDGINDNTIQGD